MIDRADITTSTLAMILFKALKGYDDKQLLEWLRDDDPIVRRAAATELHLRPSESNFAEIIALSKSVRHEQREASAHALGQFGTPSCSFAERSFDTLAALLTDKYYEVRAAAIGAVGALASLGNGPPSSIRQQVLDAAQDSRIEIKTAVGYALLSLDGEKVEATLSKLADDDSADVRAAAEFSISARAEN